jgi:hypothetical protein
MSWALQVHDAGVRAMRRIREHFQWSYELEKELA